MSKAVALGMQVKDAVTEATGTVVILLWGLAGTPEVVLSRGVKQDGDLQKQRQCWAGQLVDLESGERLDLPVEPDHESRLGEKYRDGVTGIEGVAIARSHHLNGCVQIAIQPPVNDKGEIVASYWIDDARLQHPESKELAVTAPAPRGSAWQ